MYSGPTVYCPNCHMIRPITTDGEYCAKCGQYVKPQGSYPECEKLRDHECEWNSIYPFMEWLQEKGIHLCDLGENGEYFPQGKSIESLLYKYFEVDPMKLEEERREVLEVMRKLNRPLKKK